MVNIKFKYNLKNKTNFGIKNVNTECGLLIFEVNTI